MATNTQRITTLEAFRKAHDTAHKAGTIHKHDAPPPAASLDTTRDGWGKWAEFTGADYGADCDFVAGQVTDLGAGKRITAVRQANPLGRPFVSGWYDTFGTFDMLYGTIEARIKYPNGKGVWPAFWMLPKGQRAPFPEIDILEAYPGDLSLGGPGVVVHTLHKSPTESIYKGIWVPGLPDFTLDYHVYKIIWTASRIDFYFDGALTWTATTCVPTVPMYPILSLALGNPHATPPAGQVDATTPSPLFMDIEYVRIAP